MKKLLMLLILLPTTSKAVCFGPDCPEDISVLEIIPMLVVPFGIIVIWYLVFGQDKNK